MARVLLGVSGGIAAYKACELCRLFVKDGHDVVPLVTPGRRAIRHRRDVSRARPAPRRRRRLSPPDARRPPRRRAVHGEHAREARARARRQRPHRGGARAPRADARRAGDESAHVVACRDARERRDAACARRRARRPRRGRDGRGRARRGADVGAGGHRPRGARSCSPAPGRCAASACSISAGGTREPIDAVRFVGNRSSGPDGRRARRRGAPARRARDAARREPRRAGARRASSSSRRRPRPSSSARRSPRGPEADVVIMAAAVADYRPGGGARDEAPEGPPRLDGRARADDRRARRARRRARVPGQVLVGFAADQGERGLERAREKLANKNADLFVFNDVGARRHRLRVAATTR